MRAKGILWIGTAMIALLVPAVASATDPNQLIDVWVNGQIPPPPDLTSVPTISSSGWNLQSVSCHGWYKRVNVGETNTYTMQASGKIDVDAFSAEAKAGGSHVKREDFVLDWQITCDSNYWAKVVGSGGFNREVGLLLPIAVDSQTADYGPDPVSCPYWSGGKECNYIKTELETIVMSAIGTHYIANDEVWVCAGAGAIAPLRAYNRFDDMNDAPVLVPGYGPHQKYATSKTSQVVDGTLYGGPIEQDVPLTAENPWLCQAKGVSWTDPVPVTAMINAGLNQLPPILH